MLSKKLLSACQTSTDGIVFVGGATSEITVTGGVSANASPYISFGSSAIGGVQSGDLLLVFLGDDDGQREFSDSSGWTKFMDASIVSSSYSFATYFKLATSSDTSFSVTSGATSGSGAPAASMMAFRNATVKNHRVDTFVGSDRDDPPELATESGDAAVVVQFFEDRSPKPSITTPTNYTAGPYAHSNPVHGDVTGVATFYNLSPANPVTVNDFSGDLFSSDEMVAMTVVLEPKEDKPVEMGGFRSTRSAGNPPAITTPASSGTAPLIVVGYQDNTSTSTGFNEAESPAFDQEFNVGSSAGCTFGISLYDSGDTVSDQTIDTTDRANTYNILAAFFLEVDGYSNLTYVTQNEAQGDDALSVPSSSQSGDIVIFMGRYFNAELPEPSSAFKFIFTRFLDTPAATPDDADNYFWCFAAEDDGTLGGTSLPVVSGSGFNDQVCVVIRPS